MLFDLCLEWGGRYIHPDRLAAALTAAELVEWEAYAQLRPFGSRAADYRAAQAAWAAVAPHSKRRLTVDQFMPKWGGRELPTPAEYLAKAKAAYAAAAPKARE